MNAPLLLNQPSADSFAQIESKKNRNYNAGNYEWDADEKDIEDDDTAVAIPVSSNMLGMAEDSRF